MKKTYLLIIIACFAINFSYAQNTFPSSGNVGIGTTSPIAKLHVASNQIVLSGNAPFLSFYDNTATTRYGYIQLNNSNTNLLLSNEMAGGIQFLVNGGSEKMRLDGYGNLGIGTTNPSFMLDTRKNQAGYTYINVDNSNTAATGTGEGYSFSEGGITASALREERDGTGALNLINGNGGLINLETGPTMGGATAKLTILAGGNVGIGTSTPAGKLEINDSNGTGIISYFGANGVTNAKGIYFSRPVTNTNPVNIQGTQSGIGATDISLQAEGGNVAIGTSNPQGYKLAVNGSAITTSMTVKINSAWPDYVFKSTYLLPSLTDVKAYIDKNQHLPEMPSEAEVAKDGLNLGEIVKMQTKKIEELTLYLIEKDKQVTEQQTTNQTLQKEIDGLKKQLDLIAKTLNK